MHRFQRILLVAMLAGSLATGVSAAAPEDEPEAKTLLQHMQYEIERVRLQIVNAGAKIKGGAVSMTRSEDWPDTPGFRCCGQNIVRINRHFQEMSSIWGELRECYRAEENAGAEIQANFVREDAASLMRALGVFAEAPNEGGTIGGQQAMIRAYRHLVESSGELVECGQPRVRERRQ